MSNNDPLAGLTPDVQALISQHTKKEQPGAFAPMSKWKRNQIARDKQRTKKTVDFSAHLQLVRQLEKLAENEHCGISNMIMWLIHLGLQHYQHPDKKPSNSRLHDYDIILP